MFMGHLVVVDDFNILRSRLIAPPNEAYPILLIDPDAELAVAVAAQGLQTIAWQLSEFVEARCRVKDFEPLVRLFCKALEFTNEIASGKASVRLSL
jgi:hypothetical protein